MSDKKTRISDEERKLFRETIKGIRRVKPPSMRKAAEPEDPTDRFYASTEIPNTLSAEDTLNYSKSGLQLRLLQKLKRGKIIPQASLDLHRHTVAMAEDAVDEFIRAALAHDVRCVRIVHGKGSMSKTGQARLKNWLNIWLRQHTHVLAFHSAQPKDGGKGAVYVLLKRSSG